jgi:hypothetical protein
MATVPVVQEMSLITNILSAISVAGLVGYFAHWVFTTLQNKVDKESCKEFRSLEKDSVDRIDRDLQHHKEGKK